MLNLLNQKLRVMQDFILDLVKRWGAKQPWFFKTVMYISLATAFLIGLPGFLQETAVWDALPGAWQGIVTKVAFYAGLAAAFVAKLTVKSEEKSKLKRQD